MHIGAWSIPPGSQGRYGLLEGSVGIGDAFGSWIGGYVFDLTGSYQWAFGVAVLAAALAGVVVWVAAPGKGRAFKESRPNKAF